MDGLAIHTGHATEASHRHKWAGDPHGTHMNERDVATRSDDVSVTDRVDGIESSPMDRVESSPMDQVESRIACTHRHTRGWPPLHSHAVSERTTSGPKLSEGTWSTSTSTSLPNPSHFSSFPGNLRNHLTFQHHTQRTFWMSVVAESFACGRTAIVSRARSH
jgi:hypothetical protein